MARVARETSVTFCKIWEQSKRVNCGHRRQMVSIDLSPNLEHPEISKIFRFGVVSTNTLIPRSLTFMHQPSSTTEKQKK